MSELPPRMPYADMYGIPEDERILAIGVQAMHRTVGLLLERDQPEKIARYITKVTTQFPGVRHIETVDGPVPTVVMLRFGPTAATLRGVNHLNQAPILGQLAGQWEKMVALVVFKLAREKGVMITGRDMEEFIASKLVCYTHGHGNDGISFRLVTHEEAQQIAEHEQTQQGRA